MEAYQEERRRRADAEYARQQEEGELRVSRAPESSKDSSWLSCDVRVARTNPAPSALPPPIGGFVVSHQNVSGMSDSLFRPQGRFPHCRVHGGRLMSPDGVDDDALVEDLGSDAASQ